MAKDLLENKVSMENHLLRCKQLVTRFKVTHNATPASKTHTVDVPGVVYLKTEGKNNVSGQEATAVTGTQTDASGQVGVLIALGEVVSEVSKISFEAVSSNATGTITCTRILTDGITAAGNVELQITAPGQSLAADDLEIALTLDYKV